MNFTPDNVVAAFDAAVVLMLRTEHQFAMAYEAGDAGMTSYIDAECQDAYATLNGMTALLQEHVPSHPMAKEGADLTAYCFEKNIRCVM